MFARTSQCACPFFLRRQLPTCVCGAQIFRMTGLISVKPAKGTHGAANDIKEIYCSHGRQYGKCHTCDAYYDRAVIGYFRHRKELKSAQVCKQAYTERSECDGHCSYSPDGKWMLTDSYPLEDSCRKLFLYRLEDGTAFEIGSFYSDPSYPVPTRCDLHPNWSRDGRSVCIDSIHEGSRQIYLLDVSGLTAY